MKILRVIWSMNPAAGGPPQGIRNVVPEMSKFGVSNEVVSLDQDKSSFLESDNFVIHTIGRGKGPWGYNEALIPWLLANISRFDVIIVHGLWQYTSFAVSAAIRQYKKRNPKSIPAVYVMPHGMLDPWFQKAKGRRLKAVRNWIFWKLIERRIVNESDGILFTCEAEMMLARQTFTPYHPKREINVGYGIKTPPEYSEQMRRALKDKCPSALQGEYFLFLGRINYKKGVDILIEAYEQVVIQKASEGVSVPNLVIAGPELDTDFGRSLTAIVDGNTNLQNKVFFPGMLKGDSKWGAYYNCQAFILPSHQENFGIAVVEALACGTPVLISDQVNICNEIKEEYAGLVASDTTEGTSYLLNSWLNLENEEQMRLRQNAKTAFINRFEVSAATRQFLGGIGFDSENLTI
ncbi:glycosyltransferase [Dyadobacter sp. Leaf189]|uniref:glycosyltransferase n=1 Tax=Dyadobacter sp. Leaf189 TaxID=1736295 RepID=UPI0006FD2E0F|nr:glycosyltransferase [Dyadobacter sp. Leaf189]KQS30699.1 glycosyl transferase family 1 [Dyadobacter sp. Leaf189]